MRQILSESNLEKVWIVTDDNANVSFEVEVNGVIYDYNEYVKRSTEPPPEPEPIVQVLPGATGVVEVPSKSLTPYIITSAVSVVASVILSHVIR